MSCCPCFEGVSGDSSKKKDGSKKSSFELEKQRSAREIADFHTGLEFIEKVRIFRTLERSDHPALAKAFQINKYADGVSIVKEGEVGDKFFVINSGKVRVLSASNELVNILGAEDYFGEVALLHDQVRNATIVADGEVECRELSREDFDKLGLRDKLRFPKRKAIVQTEIVDDKLSRSVTKSFENTAMLKKALRQNQNIGPYLPSNDEDLECIIKEAYPKEVEKDFELIKQGDLNANLFYVLEAGSAVAIKDGVEVAKYSKEGESFGGLALLYQAPRAATIRITSASKLWCIPRQAMRAVLRTQVSKRVETYQQILNGVSLLQSVSADDKKQLADALVETTFFKGELIIEEGDEIGRTFYILEEGELEVIVKGKVVTTYVASRGTTPHFGEKALFNDEPRAATIRVKTDRARCLVLDRDIFTKIVQPKVDDRTKGYVKYEYANLKHVGLLGCGGFGKVTLVLDKGTNLHFALKQLSKGHLLKEKQANGVMNEKKILRMTHCPFLVQVAATFNLKNHLCFLLEPAMVASYLPSTSRKSFMVKRTWRCFMQLV
jgi:CRP-like cAMP-binding protein